MITIRRDRRQRSLSVVGERKPMMINDHQKDSKFCNVIIEIIIKYNILYIIFQQENIFSKSDSVVDSTMWIVIKLSSGSYGYICMYLYVRFYLYAHHKSI